MLPNQCLICPIQSKSVPNSWVVPVWRNETFADLPLLERDFGLNDFCNPTVHIQLNFNWENSFFQNTPGAHENQLILLTSSPCAGQPVTGTPARHSARESRFASFRFKAFEGLEDLEGSKAASIRIISLGSSDEIVQRDSPTKSSSKIVLPDRLSLLPHNVRNLFANLNLDEMLGQ